MIPIIPSTAGEPAKRTKRRRLLSPLPAPASSVAGEAPSPVGEDAQNAAVLAERNRNDDDDSVDSCPALPFSLPICIVYVTLRLCASDVSLSQLIRWTRTGLLPSVVDHMPGDFLLNHSERTSNQLMPVPTYQTLSAVSDRLFHGVAPTVQMPEIYLMGIVARLLADCNLPASLIVAIRDAQEERPAGSSTMCAFKRDATTHIYTNADGWAAACVVLTLVRLFGLNGRETLLDRITDEYAAKLPTVDGGDRFFRIRKWLRYLRARRERIAADTLSVGAHRVEPILEYVRGLVAPAIYRYHSHKATSNGDQISVHNPQFSNRVRNILMRFRNGDTSRSESIASLRTQRDDRNAILSKMSPYRITSVQSGGAEEACADNDFRYSEVWQSDTSSSAYQAIVGQLSESDRLLLEGNESERTGPTLADLQTAISQRGGGHVDLGPYPNWRFPALHLVLICLADIVEQPPTEIFQLFVNFVQESPGQLFS